MAEAKRRRRKHRNFIRRHVIAIAITLLLGSYFISVLVRQEGMMKALKLEDARVQAEAAEKQRELEALEAEIERAGSDAYIEERAREELDLVREDDIVYRIKEPGEEEDD